MVNWKNKVLLLKKDARVLYFAARHPQTPWYAKAVMVLVAAYALSPVDLIPDFIPFAGWLDDLIIIPAGVYLAMRLVPQTILDEAKSANTNPAKTVKRWGYVALFAVVAVLLLVAFGIVMLIRALLG